MMFKAIGFALALYTIFATVSGRVYAKSGPGGRKVSRQDRPNYFWIVIAIYFGLSGALIFLF
jgi:hypothetical protein